MEDRFDILANQDTDRFKSLATDGTLKASLEQTPQNKFDFVAEQNDMKKQVHEAPWHSPEALLDHLFSQAPIPLAMTYKAMRGVQKQVRPEKLYKAGTRGLQKSVLGFAKEVKAPIDTNYLERLTESLTEFAGDLPIMMLGSVPGAKLGALAGAPFGAAGAGVGAAVGGAMTGFALPTAIKSVIREYRDFQKKGGDLTLKEFIERGGSVLKDTGKAAIMGGALGAVGKALPLLESLPAMKNLLNSKLGSEGIRLGAEAATLLGVNTLFEGKLPTADEVGDLVGFLATARAFGGIKDFMEKRSKKPLVPLKEQTPEEKVLGKKALPKAQRFETTQEMYQDVLENLVGEKKAKKVEVAHTWRKSLEQAEKAAKRKFTPMEHEEALYYMQKTGNPAIEGDGFNDLVKRLPKELKEMADKKVRPALETILKENNEDPVMKTIRPREGLEEYYLPGVYEGTPEQIAKAKALAYKKLKTRPFFANTKTFLTYHDAALKAGLKPRFKTLPELMEYTQNEFNRAKANAGLVDKLRKFQDITGTNVIVTDHSKAKYRKAKLEGFVPFDDKMLRTSYDKEVGKYTLSPEPALLAPDVAETFDGVFVRNYEGKLPKALQHVKNVTDAWDSINRRLNRLAVSFSGFHYKTQLENVLGRLGFEKALRPAKLMQEGDILLKDTAKVKDAVKHGLEIGGIESLTIPKNERVFDKFIDKIADPESKFSISTKKFQKRLSEVPDYIHKTFIPRLKMVAYDETVKAQLGRLEKEYGRKLTPVETKELKRVVASRMNDEFGGQRWETSTWFKNPKMRKMMRAFIAFPNWTVSNVKQLAGAFKPGLEGQLGRQYLLNFTIKNSLIAAGFKGIFGGMTTNEKGENIWSPWEALRAFTDINDVSDLFSFPLPDWNINGLRLGRDKSGARLKLYAGKQLVEALNYFKIGDHLLSMLYNKSVPLVREIWKQVTGTTPTPYGPFMAEGKYMGGIRKPWEGKQDFIEQLPSRTKSLLKDLVPFGLQSLVVERDFPKWVQTGGGLFSARKMATPFKEATNIRKALEENDTRKLADIKRKLKENDIPDERIQQEITNQKSIIKSDRYFDKAKEAVSIKDPEKRNDAVRRVKAEMRKDPLGFSENSIQGTFNYALKSLKFEGVYTEKQRGKIKTELPTLSGDLKNALLSDDKNKISEIKKQYKTSGLNKEQIDNKIKYAKNEITRDRWNEKIAAAIKSGDSSKIKKVKDDMAKDPYVNKKGIVSRFNSIKIKVKKGLL